MTSAKPILLVGSLALAGLGAALAVVSLRPSPAPPEPMEPSEFAPFRAEPNEAEGEDDEAAPDRQEVAAPEVEHEPAEASPAGQGTAEAPAEGTGQPVRHGPSVGVNPARAEEPVRLLNPVDHGTPDEPVAEGTGDPNNPFGENDQPAGTVSREQTFANNIQAQYEAVTEVIANCVEGMPPSTRDTVHVEMIVRDAPGGERSEPSIENFQSATLGEDRSACARRGFESMDLPLPWLATAVEAPGFTVVADTAVEYSLEFEVEIGAE